MSGPPRIQIRLNCRFLKILRSHALFQNSHRCYVLIGAAYIVVVKGSDAPPQISIRRQ